MRLIDADALYKQAADTAEYYCGFFNDMENVISARNIEQAPTIDAVPVVRCKDCKHRVLNENYGKAYWEIKAVCELDTGNPFELGRNAEDDDWFCAGGERKDGDGDA